MILMRSPGLNISADQPERRNVVAERILIVGEEPVHGVEAMCHAAFDGPPGLRGTEHDVGISDLGRGIQVAPVERLEGTPHDFHVLLRHVRSVSRLQPAFA